MPIPADRSLLASRKTVTIEHLKAELELITTKILEKTASKADLEKMVTKADVNELRRMIMRKTRCALW